MKNIIFFSLLCMSFSYLLSENPAPAKTEFCTCNPCTCNPCTCGLNCNCCKLDKDDCPDYTCKCTQGQVCSCTDSIGTNSTNYCSKL